MFRALKSFRQPTFKNIFAQRAFYSTQQCRVTPEAAQKYPFLQRLGLTDTDLHACNYGEGWKASGPVIESVNPSDGELVARIVSANADDCKRAIDASDKAFDTWKNITPPKRGEIVRQLGDKLRNNIEDLGAVVQLEVGKIKAEGIGEVQEGVDICDYACGLSRMMNGKVIPSERPDHAMLEQYNPLGVVGCITAFNFPTAVLFWNLAIALATGNTMVWKGAPGTPLTTLAVGRIVSSVLEENDLPGGISSTLVGGVDVGETITNDDRLPLVSFTGSTKVGGIVQKTVRERWGQTLLELGGNNAFIVQDDADIDLALRGALFGAVGTAGQRCTSTRRLLLHDKIYDSFLEKLLTAYKDIPIGNVFEDENVLCGPLHSKAQIEAYQETIRKAKEQGGKVLCGGNVLDRPGNFVEPTVIEIDPHAPVVQHETFAPILYVMRYRNFEEAVSINNQTGYGLSSSLFTKDPESIFKWMGPNGSSAGIVNVNIGTSGAEIGGAFGGNGKTGYGRESGSDAWRAYCRQSTCTINYGKELPLAQGIRFGV